MSNLLIVTPSLNQGQFIERTIRSVVSQARPGDEYVIVDADSSDETHSVIERYRPSISEVFIDASLNQAGAVRHGFTLFDSEYCAYLNSDDFLLPGALEKAISFLDANPDTGLVYGDRVFVDDSGCVTGVWALPRHSDYLMSRWDYIPQETCVWRRSAMERVGGINGGLEFALDYDLFVRMMKVTRFTHLPEYLAAFRVHSASKTQTINNTVGRPEVEKTQRANDIEISLVDRVLGKGLRHLVDFRSANALDKDLAGLQTLLET